MGVKVNVNQTNSKNANPTVKGGGAISDILSFIPLVIQPPPPKKCQPFSGLKESPKTW